MKCSAAILCFGLAAMTLIYSATTSFPMGPLFAVMLAAGGLYELDKVRRKKDDTDRSE